MESKGFSEKHRVTYYETDMNGTVGLGRLVDLMMLSCNDQSDAVGLSSEKVNQMGLGWIVTQNMIDIKRLPRRNETIYITTHAKSYNRYFCYRDFWIHDIRKQELAHMHTVFALMDQNERKIVRIPENLIEPYHSEYATKIERLSELIAKKNMKFVFGILISISTSTTFIILNGCLMRLILIF